jgi:hypothetical protein
MLLLPIAIALAGCDQTDPYLRTDTWRPSGANAGNVAAMLAYPPDLVGGRADGPSGPSATLAVERFWRDEVKPLPWWHAGAPGWGEGAPVASESHR